MLVLLALIVLFLAIISWNLRSSEIPVRLIRVVSGDTVAFDKGLTVKLLGVNTVSGGAENDALAASYLMTLLANRNVWIEYDRTGQGLAWLWVGCESSPRFWSIREANDNPVGCKQGVLVSEQIIKMGWSTPYFPADMPGVRYESRLKAINSSI